jgi:predicted GH43/DUF377 family glycosyl hydrolase
MNLVHRSILNGGKLAPLVLPFSASKGLGTMNPSVMVDSDGDILVNIRLVNYTLFISENDKRFFSPWGPLTYLHPEKDQTLRTDNYLCRLDKDYNVINYTKVEMMELHKPIWEFVGLEDARVVQWDGDYYMVGVRRDTTTNGVGRMEYSKVEIDKKNWTVKEVQRVRMPAPLHEATSYCEKNHMPIIDKPYHFVKWAMPTEVVWSNPNEPETKQVVVNDNVPRPPIDQRGGSHVIAWGDYYLCVTHEVKLWRNYLNQKDSTYRHRLLVWDKEFNFVGLSKEFAFMDTPIEFCVGAAIINDNMLLSFGVQDNSAFVLEVPKSVVNELIEEAKTYVN